MMNTIDDFTYVTLLSNSSLKYYPNNSLSRFTVKLPNVINLSANENWYVGLMSVAHTSISNEEKIPAKIKIKSTARQGFTNNKLIVLLNSAPNFYNEVKQENFFDRYSPLVKFEKEDFIRGQPFIQIEALHGVNVIIKTNIEYTPNELFDSIFKQIEKDKWEDFIKSFQNDVKNFKLTNEMQTKIQNAKDDYVDEITIKTQPFPFYVCFYCDLIKPRIIGDLSTRCLYMYPLGAVSDKSSPRSYQIDNIQYCSIEKYNISEINILITDENGEQINFEDSLFTTSLVLHFKKGI